MAPAPKPPGTRVRRNTDQPQWRSLTSDGKAKAPALPSKTPTWLKPTRDWWQAIWDSPMATAWLPSDVPVLVRLARIVDLDNRGESTAATLSEARQLEDRFGLSPRARRLLQWDVTAAAQRQATSEGDDEPSEVLPAQSDARRRLRAV